MARCLSSLLLICMMAFMSAFNVAPTSSRRQALRLGIGAAAATLGLPAAPAFAGGKASVLPNKVEGVGANAGQYLSQMRKDEYALMAGDKGSRGVASKQFEASDTVLKNRRENKGLARDATGRKITRADRNPTPESLGLKQWTGD